MTAFRRINRGRWHSYEIDGVKAPGVTTLIGAGVPKPALIGWAAKMAGECAARDIDLLARMNAAEVVSYVAGESDRRKNRAGVKGTEVHGLAQRIAAGEPVEVPEEVRGYVDAYLAWMDDWRPEIIRTEAAVASRTWWYAGTFDMLARLPDGRVSLIDIKTGGSGVWPETCLQVTAYRHAEVMLDGKLEVPMPATDVGHALWLGEGGEYEFLPVESGPDIFAVFLHVAHVGAFMTRAKDHKDSLIGLPLAPPEEVPA